ncbi:cytochrome c oxidase subunit 4 [Kluyveromyces marxianus]|mgnify:CR=1 FL=1|uniref:Cytochrome c oxidase subunit 4, mitochondrial n=2 Tax=Kluyveromyces marxianus TaxID=4911 RepID=W0TA28_KLUMD|nr:cytochrome c oxidase subunit 4 [Kluyveromyces marxianus DMKU3-1042]QGN14680.1 cytochrome c oxidase subunit 4 [Kluyveromyces marxianus]BAO38949.1 cytochrome c oxidase subunit 4 [Kluyveromyces marxianus DMKU3-1042]BAP70481.1 cytochrome c oxidase subunit 4 [Kluyveromyces marxianus]
MLSLRQSLSKLFTPAARVFSTTKVAGQQQVVKTAQNLAEVNGRDSLIGPGAKEGEVPTELEQATGLARLEMLGKLEGIEVFDTKPLDSSRIGTMENPIIIESYDDYRYVGCTGSPAGSHPTMWLKPTKDQVARDWETGTVYKLKVVGVPQEGHH